MSRFDALLDDVGRYYSAKVEEHGATPRGVDWNGEESQRLRFRELMRVHSGEGPFSINDYGCGYGALVDVLRGDRYDFSYCGFDISGEMLARAQAAFAPAEAVRFVSDEAELRPLDYTVASGILNVRLATDEATWTEYAIDVIRRVWQLSTVACSFNMLTSYSDADRKRDDLYYADPRFFFDFCKRELSPHVALLHDYGLWEFTLIVRREPAR